MKLNFLFLISIVFPFLVKCESNITKNNQSQNYDNDDDDFLPDSFNELKSKFGNVKFKVNIYPNQTCSTDSSIQTIQEFNLSNQCTCLSTDKYCYQELINHPYFLKYKWNFTNHSKYNYYNISECIFNYGKYNTSCIPCGDFYMEVEAVITRHLCWIVDIGVIILITFLVGGICMCLFGYSYSRRRRFGYQTIITTDNSQNTKYRFYTK